MWWLTLKVKREKERNNKVRIQIHVCIDVKENTQIKVIEICRIKNQYGIYHLFILSLLSTESKK